MLQYLPYITAIIAIGGFVFSVWKYIDLKNREEKRLDYENFNKILSNLSGEILANGEIKTEIGFVIANIYQLLNFIKYKDVSLPVLEYHKNCPIKTDEKSLKYVTKAIDDVLEKLK
jgi:hypothetical protein